MTMKPPGRRLATFGLLFALCFGVRVGLILGRDLPGGLERIHGAKFGYEMNRAGLAVMKTGSIRDIFDDDSGPSAHVSPAYPYILGGLYRLVGPDPRRMWLAQALLSAAIASAAIALLPAVAGATGLRPGVGLLAAVPMVFSPFDQGLEIHGEWEQPPAALTLLLVLLNAASRRRDGWRSTGGAVRSGLLLGWSALLSPPIALAAGLIPIAEFWAHPADRRRIARGFAIEVAILAVALAPWMIRNYRELGGFVPLRSNFGLEVSLVCHDGSTGYFDAGSLARHPLSSKSELAEYERVGELAYMRSKASAARDWIAAHPLRYAGQMADRAARFWFWPVPDWFQVDNPAMARVYFASVRLTSAMNLLAMLGLIGLFLRRHPARLLFAIALFGPTLIYAMIQVMARYGYPARPVAWLLAMDLVVGLIARLGRRMPGSPEARLDPA